MNATVPDKVKLIHWNLVQQKTQAKASLLYFWLSLMQKMIRNTRLQCSLTKSFDEDRWWNWLPAWKSHQTPFFPRNGLWYIGAQPWDSHPLDWPWTSSYGLELILFSIRFSEIRWELLCLSLVPHTIVLSLRQKMKKKRSNLCSHVILYHQRQKITIARFKETLPYIKSHCEL